MKTILSLIMISYALCVSNCDETSLDITPCYEGIVIGKIRSWGGGVAVSMKDSTFSNHSWNNYTHVVEALNIPDSLWNPGIHIFFSARLATESEINTPRSSDGDESAKPYIYVVQVSSIKCPETSEL